MFYSEMLLSILINLGRIPEKVSEYVWTKDFKKGLNNILIDNASSNLPIISVYEAYKNGFNIGYCDLMARYLYKTFEKSDNKFVVKGKCEALKGSKNSNDGNHVWVEADGYLYDPTLCLKIPQDMAIEMLGYKDFYFLAPESAREISEYEWFYDYYDAELQRFKPLKEYISEILLVNK